MINWIKKLFKKEEQAPKWRQDYLYEEWDNHRNINIYSFCDGEIIGRCQLEITDEFFKLQGLYIQPEHRKKGYGKLLVEDALFFFNRRKEYDLLWIKVNKNYTRLIEWYKTQRFEYNQDAEGDYIWMTYKK